MLEGLNARFGDEKAAIEALRAKFPDTAQKTLARRIREMDFKMEDNKAMALKASTRSLLSIYSVIRRYDAAQDAKRAAAIAENSALVARDNAAARDTLTKGQLVTA